MSEWVIDQPLDDTQAETVAEQLKAHDRIVIRHHDLGGAVVQLLLCATADKQVVVETESISLKRVFENPRVEQGA
jgi:phage tail sheath protein FI